MEKEKGLITKGRYELKFRGTSCTNCGHVLDLDDKYCSNCGQANSTKRLVLKDFFDEFLSSIINYDSKLLRTLYAMLLKPGSITKDYIKGKRISYTNPFRFLLSLAFLYFLMVTYDNSLENLDTLRLEDKFEKTGPMSFRFVEDKLEKDTLAGEDEPVDIFKTLDSLSSVDNGSGPSIKNIDSLGTIIKEGLNKEALKDSLMLADPKGYFEGLEKDNSGNLFDKMKFFYTFLKNDSLRTFSEAQEKFGIKSGLRNKMAFNGSNSAIRVIEQPGTYLNDTIAKLPLVIFFFLPIFTIFIFLVYIRKKYTYTDHLIFSFHNQSLLFILLILSWVIDAIFNTRTVWIAVTIFSIYLFQAMRRFYGQGIFKTIIKYLFLNSAFLFLALIFVVLLFTGSIFTY